MTRAAQPRGRHSTPESEFGAFGHDSPGMQTGGIRAVVPRAGGARTPDSFAGVSGSTLEASAPPARPDFAAIQASPDFAELRSRLRRFVFPMSALFLTWYMTFVLLAAYAPGFMGTKVLGLITVGMVMGVAQFVTTLLITLTYNRFARRRIDPQVNLIREQAGVGPA